MLEETHKDHQVELPAAGRTIKTKPCDWESIVQMLPELWQAWGSDHFPGKPIPVMP